MASSTVPSLSDQDLAELLALIKGADSVELKLSVPMSNRTRAGAALGVDPLDGQIRQVYFFDTPDLALNKSGVVVRARRVQQREDDSVVKLRPVVPDELPAEVRRSPNFGVEVDAMPGGFVCSGSMKHALGPMDVKDAVAGKQPLRKLFSKEQRALYAAHAPEGLELDDLSILGPVLVLKVKFAPEGYGRRLVAELWLYPDNSMLLELSTKCAPSDAFQIAAETRSLPGRNMGSTSRASRRRRRRRRWSSSPGSYRQPPSRNPSSPRVPTRPGSTPSQGRRRSSAAGNGGRSVRHFGAADDRFAALSPERVQESDELYLLSPVVDVTVKIRADLMDIKRRQRVNGDGLEQWAPIMKAAFPLPAADVSRVFAALAVPVPSLARTEYTLDQFVDELVRPNRVSPRGARRTRSAFVTPSTAVWPR